jgi:hypothetical protein
MQRSLESETGKECPAPNKQTYVIGCAVQSYKGGECGDGRWEMITCHGPRTSDDYIEYVPYLAA